MTINSDVVQFARTNLNRRVGRRGECFDLADRALRAAGALSADHYGAITRDADYVWGLRVMLSSVRPGDIVQFRNYRADINNETAWEKKPGAAPIIRPSSPLSARTG